MSLIDNGNDLIFRDIIHFLLGIYPKKTADLLAEKIIQKDQRSKNFSQGLIGSQIAQCDLTMLFGTDTIKSSKKENRI